jgi:REP element-mobilizing transposase RayT
LPQDKLRQWYTEEEQWLAQHPEPHDEATRAEYQRRFPDRLQQWLDAGYGECLLRKREVADAVEQALRHFDGERYELGDFVIMPNHLHALVTPLGELTLEEILHSWKSYTAHEINGLLQRTGTVWQPEYFDHLVPNAHCLEQFAAYIEENPVRAGLRAGEFRVARASRPFRSVGQHHGRDARATDK